VGDTVRSSVREEGPGVVAPSRRGVHSVCGGLQYSVVKNASSLYNMVKDQC